MNATFRCLTVYATDVESVRPPTNDERRAAWAARYYSRGLHRASRWHVAVPAPLCRAALRPNPSIPAEWPGANPDDMTDSERDAWAERILSGAEEAF